MTERAGQPGTVLGRIRDVVRGGTGTLIFNALHGEKVGSDAQGNTYYRKPARDGRPERRWVIYSGANDASRVPAEWHGWLHGSYDGVPESNLPPPRIWEADYTPNATGTAQAYRPQGALERGGLTVSLARRPQEIAVDAATVEKP